MHVSSLPALFDCPSSQLPTTHPYDPQSDVADLGNAVHEALADHVAGDDPDVEAIARAHGVEARDVYPLVAMGKMAWDEVREHFPKPAVEHRLADDDNLRGRADVFSLTDESMSVLDWKTNRERADYGGQMLGYAACAEAQYGMPEGGHITVAIVWLRLGEIDITRVYQDDIERFHHKMKRALMDVGKRYAPGKACTFCRRQLVCQAKQEFIQSSVRSLQPWVEGKMIPLHGLNTLYPQAKALGRALDQYKEALKLLVRQHGPQPDGGHNASNPTTRRKRPSSPRHDPSPPRPRAGRDRRKRGRQPNAGWHSPCARTQDLPPGD